MASMKHLAESSTQKVLAGVVERVTFHNAESGFRVLRIKARGHRDLVTVIGRAVTISAEGMGHRIEWPRWTAYDRGTWRRSRVKIRTGPAALDPKRSFAATAQTAAIGR